MKLIGITGAEGNIGKTLREGLTERYHLCCFTLKKQDFPSFVGDLSKREFLYDKFFGLDAVIHLAADPSPGASWKSALDNNIRATQHVFDEAAKAGVKKVVFASTNHVQHGHTMKTAPETLDTSIERMITLQTPTLPDSLYAVSKVCGEELGKYYARIYNIQVIALRIGWTFQEDDPTIKKGQKEEDYMRAMFLSKRDCINYFARAIEVNLSKIETETPNFLLAYALSNNGKRVFCLDETIEKLGYNPQDDAEDYFKKAKELARVRAELEALTQAFDKELEKRKKKER